MSLGANSAGEVVMAVVATDSFCFNTNNNNKEPYPALCDLNQTATPFVLTYTHGTIGIVHGVR